MKNYLLSLIITSIAVGLCEVITPSHNGIQKYVRFIGMLIVLCVAASPITALVGEINDGLVDSIKDKISNGLEDKNDYNEILNEFLTNNSSQQLEDKIYELLEAEFGIYQEDARINILVDRLSDGVKLSLIEVLLSGNAIFKNPYTIENRLSNLFGCDVQVLIHKK